MAARVAGLKGLNGKLRLVDASAFLRSAHAGDEVAFVPPAEEGLRFARIARIDEQGDAVCSILLEEASCADDVRSLAGRSLLLKGAALGDALSEDELAWLVGYELADAGSGPVGIIASVDAGPERIQPLLSVRTLADPERIALVPFAEELLIGIDEDAQRVEMALPRGIMDL